MKNAYAADLLHKRCFLGPFIHTYFMKHKTTLYAHMKHMTALYLTLSSKKQTNTLLSIHFRAVLPSMAVPIGRTGLSRDFRIASSCISAPMRIRPSSLSLRDYYEGKIMCRYNARDDK